MTLAPVGGVCAPWLAVISDAFHSSLRGASQDDQFVGTICEKAFWKARGSGDASL